jgi:hypothetical protein
MLPIRRPAAECHVSRVDGPNGADAVPARRDAWKVWRPLRPACPRIEAEGPTRLCGYDRAPRL